jgi:hypothetical protein
MINVWHMQASERQQGGEGQLLLEVLPRDEWSALLNNGARSVGVCFSLLSAPGYPESSLWLGGA